MNEARRKFLISLALFAAVVAVFGQSARFDWVRYDDGDYVYRSAAVTRGLTIANLGWAFTHVHASNWHPLTTLSHMADCSLFGLSPGPMHAVNVLLHGLTTILLFLGLTALTGRTWRSAFVAALFALHPLRAESVAWIAERKDVLSGLFFAALLWRYARYARRPGFGHYLLCLLCAALGLLSKPTLVTVPFVLLLLDFWPLRRTETMKRLLGEKIPFALLAAGGAFSTLLAQRGAMTAAQLPLSLRLENALVSYVIYFRQTLWPVKLAALYPQPESYYPWLTILGCGTLLLAISLAVIRSWARRPYLLIGWLWFLGMLVPVIGLVQVGRQAHADRYTYLPQIGLLMAVVWWAAEFRLCREMVAIAGGLAVLILGGMAFHQTGYWRNAETLWPHTLAVTERNDGAHLAFATALISEGKADAAAAEVRAATEIRPSNAGVFGEVPLAATKEQIDAGLEFWRARTEDNPNDLSARTNLGVLLARSHRAREALQEWEMVLASSPGDGNAENNIAWVLSTAPDPSLRNGRRAVELGEHITTLAGGMNPVVLRTLAAAYAEAGRFEDATATAERGAEISRREGNQPLAKDLSETAVRYRRRQPTRDLTLSE